jgi:hypothetical protein
MKLSYKTILPIILISALLILLAGCLGVPNAPPTITSTPDTYICPCDPPNTIYEYYITAEDTDSTDLNFVLVQYPENMTITKTGPYSATISWAANCTESQKCFSCSYNIKIKVSDEYSEVFESYILQVQEEDCP